MEYVPLIVGGVIFLACIVLFLTHIHVVKQGHSYVIERFGVFRTIWGSGFHVLIPFMERIAKKVSLKEQVLDYPPQQMITKDNIDIQIHFPVFFKITDPKLYTYGVEQPMIAMETLVTIFLRNIIGDFEASQIKLSRDSINTKLCTLLNEGVKTWGIEVIRVEIWTP